MRLIAVCFALAFRLAAQAADDDPAKAEDVLKAARAVLGAKLATVRSLSFWGDDQRGAQACKMSFTIDLSGKYLKEQSTFSTGGQVQRMAGDGAAGGGMPGDDGGPAFAPGLTEGFDGDNYWSRNGAGSGKDVFAGNFARYALALTLSPPGGLGMTYTYGGRLEGPHGTMDALEAKGPGDFLVHLYLDAKTHLPVAMVYHQGAQEIQLWLKDYKVEEGVRFPHTMAWLVDGNPVEEFQIQHFKINPKLGPEKFRR